MNRFVQTLTLAVTSSLSVLAVQSVQAQEVPALATKSSQTSEPTATLLEVADLFPKVTSKTIPISTKTTEPHPKSSLSLSTAATTPTTEIKDSPPVSTQAADLMAQAPPIKDQFVQVTGVNIQSTTTGIEIKLEASAANTLRSSIQVEGTTLITEIDNAVLALPGGQPFRQQNPATGIREITVTQVQPTRIQVRVAGSEAAPEVNVSSGTEGLVLAVTLGLGEEEETEITVTAEKEQEGYRVPNTSVGTRTNTPILDTPASIQVIPSEVLEDQQVIQLEEALRNLAGVIPSETAGNTQTNFTIRGFDSVPILRDGFRQFPFNRGQPETADLERIEVLRGPASILFGEVQPGGVINLVSKAPLSEPFYEARLQIGNRAQIRPQLDISGPLTSDGNLLYRLNALYSTRNSFTEAEQDFERFFVAPVITWQPGERTELTVRLQYSDDATPIDGGLVAIGDEVADIPFDRVINEPDDFGTRQELLNVGYDFEHRFDDNWRLRNAFRFRDFDNLNINHNNFGIDDSGIATRFFGSQDIDNQNFGLQTSIIGEFATGSIEHTLLFGVDFSRNEETEITKVDISDPRPINIFDPVYGAFPDVDPDDLPVVVNRDDQIDRFGIYLQDQIKLLDNLILLAGVRYDRVSRTSVNGPTNFNPLSSEVTQDDDAVTPRVGIVYQPIPTLSLYGSYSQSFTPSTATNAAGEPLETERGEGFEVGIKAELLEGRLAATLAYFDITRQNVATADPNPPPTNPFASVATGEQRSRGIELDMVGEILPGWKIIASYAYIDAEVTEGNAAEVGNRLNNTPEHSASLWTTYEIQEGDLQGLGFGVGLNFVGERQGDLANSFQVDSYFLTNAAIFYRRNNWRFALNFENLFDIDYIEAVANRRFASMRPGEPFTIIGSISVEF